MQTFFYMSIRRQLQALLRSAWEFGSPIISPSGRFARRTSMHTTAPCILAACDYLYSPLQCRCCRTSWPLIERPQSEQPKIEAQRAHGSSSDAGADCTQASQPVLAHVYIYIYIYLYMYTYVDVYGQKGRLTPKLEPFGIGDRRHRGSARAGAAPKDLQVRSCSPGVRVRPLDFSREVKKQHFCLVASALCLILNRFKQHAAKAVATKFSECGGKFLRQPRLFSG